MFILPRHQQYNRDECAGGWEDYLFPASDEYLFESFHFFDSKAGEAPFPVHSLLPDFAGCGEFPTVFDGDPHYNETGHKVASEAILQYLDSDGLIP